MHGVGVISGTDYVLWVQRSLNRNFGVNLRPDGTITPDYRREIKEFQLWYVPQYYNANEADSRLGKVDEVTQNMLIESNHTRDAYLRWVQTALTKVGLTTPVTGVLDLPTLKNIKSFQALTKPTLKVDGWVGSKTETHLWRESGILPPGSTYNEVKPPPADKPWHEGAKNKRAILKIFRRRFSDEITTSVKPPFISVEPVFRYVYRDLARYFFDERPFIDTGFLTSVRVAEFATSKGWKATWQNLDDASSDAHEMALKAFNDVFDNTVQYNTKEKAYAAFAEKIVDLCKTIDRGRNEMDRHQSINGDMGNIRNLFGWWMWKEQAPSDMFYAFRKNLPQPTWWDKMWSYVVPDFPTSS